MLTQIAQRSFSGCIALFVVFLLSVSRLFGQDQLDHGITWEKSSSAIPERIIAYDPGLTKFGHMLTGVSSYCGLTQWVVAELTEYESDKSDRAPFPGGEVVEPPVTGFIAINMISHEIKFLSNPSLASTQWTIAPGMANILSDGSLVIIVNSKMKDNTQRLAWRWDISSDRLSFLGDWSKVDFSLLSALEDTDYTVDWDAESRRKDAGSMIELQHRDGGRSLALMRKNIYYRSPTLNSGERFLPGSQKTELIQVREAYGRDESTIRCLVLDSSIREKWSLSPQRLSELTGLRVCRTCVPRGLRRPCNQMPVVISDLISARVWMLETSTGQMRSGWTHEQLSTPLVGDFGSMSSNRDVLAVRLESDFYLFESATSKVLFGKNAGFPMLWPVGISNDSGKVVVTDRAAIWTISPPYSGAPERIFQLRLPPELLRPSTTNQK